MRKVIFTLLAFLVIGTSANLTSAALIVPSTSVTSEPDPAKVKSATEEFRNLSAKEKRHRLKDVKKEIRKHKTAEKNGQEPSTNTLLLVILAILLPPLAVYLHQGEINSKFWISLLLTLLFWVPGIIYALIVILGNN